MQAKHDSKVPPTANLKHHSHTETSKAYHVPCHAPSQHQFVEQDATERTPNRSEPAVGANRLTIFITTTSGSGFRRHRTKTTKTSLKIVCSFANSSYNPSTKKKSPKICPLRTKSPWPVAQESGRWGSAFGKHLISIDSPKLDTTPLLPYHINPKNPKPLNP